MMVLDDFTKFVAEFELRRVLSDELLAEVEHAKRELLSLTDEGVPAGQFRRILQQTVTVGERELSRRRQLAARGGPFVPEKTPVSPELVKWIKSRVSIAELIGRDVPVRYRGHAQIHAKCPVHGDGEDRNPSLVIYEDEGRWWCYGCNSGGDHIAWLQAYRHVGFREALQILCDMAGIPLPEPKQPEVRTGFRGFSRV